MKIYLFPGALALVCAVQVSAKQWVDYVPEKGFWQYTYVKVDVNYIDDYVSRLKDIWVPGREIDKKHGLIDDYKVMINVNNADSVGNVLLCVHYVSFAGLDPLRQRDMAIQEENDVALPKPKLDAALTDLSKYRIFTGSAIYVPVEFTK